MVNALIIDDSRQAANGLQQILGLLGVESEVAYGSRPGLEYLKTKSPELVFLDINMPGVDGFEVLAYLRRHPHLINVPVIIVSSEDQPETMEKAMEFNVLEFLLKPVSIEIVENALIKLGIIPFTKNI